MTRVLLHGPGLSGPEVPGLVARLARDGARVDLLDAVGDPHLDDLAARGLCRHVSHVDPLGYDEVRRLGDPEASLAEGAALGASVGLDADDLDGHPPTTGRVTLVGGGPGDPGLLTVAGLQAVRRADVIVCDRLAPLDVLAEARADARIIHVGKIPRGAFTPQEEINRLLLEHAGAGRHVVRFKGGDNFVFGRGGEEWLACREAGLDVEVVPGVTSAIAVPALAGIPVTHRNLTQGFTVVSGHVAPDDPRCDLDWSALAQTRTTLVVLMGVKNLPAILAALVGGGLDPATPAATIADGAMPSERRVVATVSTLPAAVQAAGLGAPAITVIGDVVTALDAPGSPSDDEARTR